MINFTIRMYVVSDHPFITCCVLIKPPCHILRPRRCVCFMFLRPKNLYFRNEDIFIITSVPLCLLRVFTSYLNFGSWERPPKGGPLSRHFPPCKPLIMFFFIYDANYFIKFLNKNYFINGLKTGRLYILYRYC